MDKLQAAEQFRRAVQLFAAQLGETQAREVATIYPRYAPGTAYTRGQYITAGEDGNGDPLLYRVEQDHSSQEDWPPASTQALYTCISLTPGGYPLWSPPTGAQDAYKTGDIVSYEEQLWQSKIDGNATPPGSDERWWSRYTEA